MFLSCLFFLAVFRAAVWIHPIKAWRCSWWPLANRTCQRFCSDPSPHTRKPHADTLCPHVGVWIQLLLLFYSRFQSSHHNIEEANMLQNYTVIQEMFSIHTALDRSSFSSTICLNVVINCFTCGIITFLKWPVWAVKGEQTMNCPFSVIMVPLLCPSQVQYYDNWRLAVPSQDTPLHQVTALKNTAFWFWFLHWLKLSSSKAFLHFVSILVQNGLIHLVLYMLMLLFVVGSMF